MTTPLDSEKISEWLHLAELIADLAASQGIQSIVGTKKQEAKVNRDGDMSFENDILKCGNLTIPLYSRPMTALLIQSFFDDSDLFQSKEVILKKVYKSVRGQNYRIRHAKHQNLLKLISRSRLFLEKVCSKTESGYLISWLIYDKKRKGYHLFKISPLKRYE